MENTNTRITITDEATGRLTSFRFDPERDTVEQLKNWVARIITINANQK